MEEFDSTPLESWSSLGWSTEKSREQSEKQRESYKKAQAQIQKSQKDEKKAQWDNEDLFRILERFIQNPYYDELVPSITELLQISVPSRFILSMIALFYPEASLHILKHIGREKDIDILLSLHRDEAMVDFSENTLHPTIRNWVSTWIHAGQAYLTDESMSVVMQKKLLHVMDTEKIISDTLSRGLTFFFTTRNLRVHPSTMESYARHILREYKAALTDSLSTADTEITYVPDFWEDAFFGFSK